VAKERAVLKTFIGVKVFATFLAPESAREEFRVKNKRA
jgi:hypothetical protein